MLMRIALLVPAPFGTVSGGCAYDRRIVQGLSAAGHEVEVVELGGSHPLPDDAAKEAARRAWQELPENTLPVIDGLGLPAFTDLADALERRAVGLIHHPTALANGLLDSDRAALRGLERQLLPRLPKVIATSQSSAERLAAEFCVAPERIAVVVPGTDEVPRSVGSAAPGCAILSVGALVPRKGHDQLLRAVARLFDLDWSLTIVASGARDPTHAHGLQALAEELGIAQRVCFAGDPGEHGGDGAALERLWHHADLFALATRWEGYGVAVAEALKHGLPVAITSAAAAGLVVPADAGVICPPGDHEGLSKAMRRLIFDADLRRFVADTAWEAGRLLPDWTTQTEAFAAALA
jgi:glycosyltransferase involved in cell wall biosynthesis